MSYTQSAQRGYVICTRLPSTQTSGPRITTERWTQASGTPQCTHTWTQSPLTIWQHSTWRQSCPGRASDIAEPRAAVLYFGSQHNSSSANRGSSRILWKPKVVPIVSQINPVTPFHPVSLQVQWGMLQRTMLQRTQRNTIGRRSTRVRMTCRAFPLWLVIIFIG